ncbi:DUF4747 family protein [Vibrio cyclitrophicus]
MSLRSVTYTAFNLRTHPHTPKTYVELLNDLFMLRKQVHLRGDTYGILSSLKLLDEAKPLKGMRGEISKFTRIEDGNWLNIQTLQAADEEDTQQIVIPEELKPNHSSFNFVFYPLSHYLVIECKDTFGSISPNYLHTYFRTALDSDEIEDKYNKVELTLIPEKNQLKNVLSINNMSLLEIVLRRPNTDGLDELDEDILDRLNNQNIAEETITYKAQKGLSIEADEKTLALSRVAQLNGLVRAKGTDKNGKSVSLSTVSHPMKVTDRYSTKSTDKISFLLQMGENVVNKIKQMRLGE